MKLEPKPKGHWPRGKRRNPDNGDWMTVLLDLRSLLRDHEDRGTISRRAVAAACQVTPRSIIKYLDETSRPSPETQTRIKAWVRLMREKLLPLKRTTKKA